MSDQDTIYLDDDMAEVFEELADARAAKKAAADRESEARKVLVAAIKEAGAHQALTASGRGVVLNVQVRKTVSGKKLEAMFPEIYEQVATESEVEVLNLVD